MPKYNEMVGCDLIHIYQVKEVLWLMILISR